MIATPVSLGGHEETASTRKVGLKRTIDYIEALV